MVITLQWMVGFMGIALIEVKKRRDLFLSRRLWINGESVSRFVERKALSAFFQMVFVKQCIDVAVAAGFADLFPKAVENGGHTCRIVSEFVGAGAVCSHCIDLIFHRAGCQEQLVRLDSCHRPV